MRGFKTVAFGVLLAATSILSNQEMALFISEHLPSVGGAIGTIIVVLRAITSSSIFKK